MPNLNSPSSLARGQGDRLIEGNAPALTERLRNRNAHIAVLGLGYAGLPMAVELARAGFYVTGLDVDEERVHAVNQKKSPVSDITDADAAILVEGARFRASSDFSLLGEVDCALICVPTPLTPKREPDLRYVQAAAQSIAAYLHPGMLIVLQSTCGPGTTRKVVLPTLEGKSRLRLGEDFFIAYAPERIDPGNSQFTLHNTPKLVGGITSQCSKMAALLFMSIVEHIVTVSSPEVAEMSKLVENTFRFINISFVNEMALLCDRMDINVWEVIGAASTKPFGFMPHYPGPGVGGHCIPVMPFYLQAAAQELGMVSELIEASGRINDEMSGFVVAKLERLLAERGRSLTNTRILILGVAYKANVGDTRGSPALRVLELLMERGACVAYYDPHVPSVCVGEGTVTSVAAHELGEKRFDCALLLTAHSGIDYSQIARRVDLFFDTRNHLLALDGATVARI